MADPNFDLQITVSANQSWTSQTIPCTGDTCHLFVVSVKVLANARLWKQCNTGRQQKEIRQLRF